MLTATRPRTHPMVVGLWRAGGVDGGKTEQKSSISAENCSKSSSKMASKGGADQNPQGTQELTEFVQNLLQQMQSRFQEMSEAIISRIDEMGSRIDDLEKSIGELMTQTGVEESGQGANEK